MNADCERLLNVRWWFGRVAAKVDTAIGAVLQMTDTGTHAKEATSVARTDGPLALARELASGTLFGDVRLVEVRETHASIVFLTSHDVYKLKKPVDLGFLNYSTLRRRARMCREEVEVNRALAPNVYLGVERITRDHDRALRLNGRGHVMDYLVHMRRLPDEAAFDASLRSGLAGVDEARRIGARVGRFHSVALRGPRAYGPATFLRNAGDNLATLSASNSGFPVSLLDELAAYFREMSSVAKAALHRRVADGWVRDGHGDLRAEHVYLEDGITIIDRVEFNRRYRTSDTALDFAFLIMDVIACGYPDMVAPLLQGYEPVVGDSVRDVLQFYCWYRALVRAKVADILAQTDGLPDDMRLASTLSARRHLYYALRFARGETRPVLVAVGGLPGTGKSTLAGALGSVIGASVQSADETRKRLAGLGPGAHPNAAIDQGIYTEEINRRVYGTLSDTADRALARGRSVVLDATFRRVADREAVRSLAERQGARFLFVECVAPEGVVRERLRRRAIEPDPWSDATEATFDAQLRTYRSPDEPADASVVSTTGPVIEQVESIVWTL